MEGGESAPTFVPANEVKAVALSTKDTSDPNYPPPGSRLKLCHRENPVSHISRKLHRLLLDSGPQRDLMSGNGGLLVTSYCMCRH